MGLTVTLEDEDAARINAVEDPANILHRILPSPDDAKFPFLRYVDWYGDTVFNRSQIGDVLKELLRLSDAARAEEERDLLARIIALARRCRSEPHLYLKFYGD